MPTPFRSTPVAEPASPVALPLSVRWNLLAMSVWRRLALCAPVLLLLWVAVWWARDGHTPV